MINNSNHIDNWLQQSAAMGNTPFDNADWMAMQQLLEKKRKRKLLIIWFVVGIAILGITLFFLLNMHIVTQQTAIKNENNTTVETEHQNKINIQHTDIKRNSVLNNDSITISKKNVDINKNDKKNALTEPVLNKLNDKKSVVKNDDATNSNKSVNPKAVNKKIIGIATDKLNNTYNNTIIKDFAIPKKQAAANNNVFDVLNKIENGNNNIVSKGYLPEIKYMHNRYIDSLKSTIILKDSTAIVNALKQQTSKKDSTQNTNKNNTKKATKQKKYLEVGAGFASLNIGNEMQTGLIKLNYSISILKNLYIDIGSKTFLFNAAQTQTHNNIYDIQQTAGTIDKIIFFKQTTYKINSGLGIEPSIGLHYQVNKIDIGAAFNYGMILNKNNNTQVYTDTMLPTFLLPPTIPANNVKISGGDYNSKNFIGKSYSTISVSCAYALSNKWKLQASYGNLFWYNKVEGVLDESKKKSSFYFTVGYRF